MEEVHITLAAFIGTGFLLLDGSTTTNTRKVGIILCHWVWHYAKILSISSCISCEERFCIHRRLWAKAHETQCFCGPVVGDYQKGKRSDKGSLPLVCEDVAPPPQ